MSERTFPHPKSLLSSANAHSAVLMSGRLCVQFVPFANSENYRGKEGRMAAGFLGPEDLTLLLAFSF